MADLDRGAVLELLNRLGDPSDETVLQAARELNRKLGDAGMTWDDVLRPDDNAIEDLADDAPFDETALAETGTGGVSAEDRAEVGRLVERLLARKNLSETMREDLAEFKRTIADGSIDAMDCKYIRALARRLDA
jgi:hypothetical protein